MIKVGDKTIDNNSLYFIADIGANHDGDLIKAKELIHACYESGADAAKFQNFSANKIVSKYGFNNLGGAMSHQSKWKDDVYTVYQKASINSDWTQELREECNKYNIDYFTSPYDFDAVDSVNEFVDVFKIGSGDITWHDIIHYVCSKGKPVLIATGASTLAEVKLAVNVIRSYNVPYVLMQCNTNYTGSDRNYDYVNLNVLNQYKALFPDAVLGLSDHTFGHATAAGAIALGARFIEKHFTLNNTHEGPDHFFAMNPKTWREMVDVSNQVLRSMGDGAKKIEENEKQSIIVQRRALRATKYLRKGHVVTREDLESLRPCPSDAYLPFEAEMIIGSTLEEAVKQGDYFRRK